MQSKKKLNLLIVTLALFFPVLIWTIPAFGLPVSSFRIREQIQRTGWWYKQVSAGKEVTPTNDKGGRHAHRPRARGLCQRPTERQTGLGYPAL